MSKLRKFVEIPPDFLESVATISDRMPKLYYHPNRYARKFFWLRLKRIYRYTYMFVKKRNKCLDFGCGTGIFLPTLSRVFRTVHGIDLEIAEAKKVLEKYPCTNVTLYNEDIETAGLEGFYDAVFAADVLEHFKNPHIAIKKIKEWLDDDGYLFTSLPTENLFTRLTRVVGKYQKPFDHYHTGYQVEQMIADNGFRKVESEIVLPLFPLYLVSVWKKDK